MTAPAPRPASVPAFTPGIPGGGGDGPAPPVRCQICGSTSLRPGADLGHQPVGDLILTRADLNAPETSYPMQVFHCTVCGLTQLGFIVDPATVYRNFPFLSGTTRTATRHLQSLPRTLVKRFALTERSFAIDIGSNDGTLLKGYLPHGVKFLGVDPAGHPVRLANEQGLETLHAFFDEATAAYVATRHGQAHAITACGCFAHIADLAGLMKGVTLLLGRGGVFATDSQYWLDMVTSLHYDNIFHQHLRYYAMRPLMALHRQYGMEVFDVERSDVHGGSIRVYAGHAGDHPISKRVERLVAEEDRRALYEPSTTERFARKVAHRRDRLFERVANLNARGRKVIGIGAPAKASTVCCYCRLDRQHIDYITEVNPLRIGKYLPGAHIPIVDEVVMFDDPRPADAAILFAWNYYDEVVPKLRKRGFTGRVVLP